ncbi:MAG: alpha/beta fold hydrolase [Myxococcales bacterium]|nr:alpha/beta fold hydrolase [Myxococcales bacterium]
MDLAVSVPSDITPPAPAWLTRHRFDVPRRHLRVADARLHLLGDDPRLLFVHGSPLWSFTWRHSMRALGGLAMDLPGLGDSSAPLDERPFERNAHVIEALMESVDARDTILVAHATAGPSALAAAARKRERLAGLVLVNTFGWDLAPTPLGRMVRIVSSAPFRFVDERLALLARVTARFGRRTGRFDAEERQAWLGPYERLETRRHLGAMLRGLRTEAPFFRAVERDLARLADVPTLLLYGAHDNNAKVGHPERFQDTMKRSLAVRLPGSGHFAMEDEPAAFTGALGSFLSRVRR